ncbi:MAG: serine hydrolase domain-containing protein [Gammaproteobacteria bacterium]
MRRLFFVIAMLVASGALAAPAPPDLVGLWGVEKTFGPPVGGTLVIDGRASDWHAGIGGFSLSVLHKGRSVGFRLPDNQGVFRGEIGKDSAEIVGQWIQPPGTLYNNAYATPVVLRRIESGVWQGKVAPLSESLLLYLDVTRNADGTLSGSYRNPQFNFGHGNPYAITIVGDVVSLASTRNKSDKMQATYLPDNDVLELHVRQLDAPLRLTRRNRGSALGFYPQTPVSSAYAYRVPVRENDGWRTDSLSAVDLDQKPLRALLDRILDTRYAGFHTPYIHSLLIARHGKLVLEKYFYGYDRDRVHDMRSAGKTFAGVLVGLAMAHGAKFDLSTPAYSLFPEYKQIANLDARKHAMTVEDLLTMTSGLACDDNDDASPGNEDTMQNQHKQFDWYLYTLDLPMAHAPGGKQAVYCSAGINLLGGIVRNTTGTPIPEFFYDYVARPLDIRHYHINLMPTGAAYMGGGIEMRPRDQLKLGQLYLDGGVWYGRRVIASKWVKESLRVHSRFAADHGYGFAWHIIDLESGGKAYRLYEAGGNGGQFVLIIPKLDMVVGFTAGNYGDFRTWYKFMTELVPKYVIPAAAK